MKPNTINFITIPKLLLISTLLLLSLTITSFYNDNSNARNSTSDRGDGRCDISRGEWIWDQNATYYTNMTCWSIQEHQNCMKYGRPDMEFLKWRWKPERCELARFDPLLFLEGVRGKSLAFVGDSLARNHMQSLMCLLSKVEYPNDISSTSNENFKRMFYANYNFTIAIFWSPFLLKSDNPDDHNHLWNLYLDEVDDAWSTKIDEFDYMILSGGNWFTRPSMFYLKRKLVGCHYCQLNNITDLTLKYSHRMAFRTAFQAIYKSTNFKGVVFLRTLSPSHFENGEWDKGGDCVRTRPFGKDELRLEGMELELYRAQIEEFRVAEVQERVKRGLRFRVLDTTEAMLLRPDGHPSRYGHWPNENVTLYNDCVHWCLPGPIDVWNDFLFHKLGFGWSL